MLFNRLKISRLPYDAFFYVQSEFPCAAPYCYRWLPCLAFGKIKEEKQRREWWKRASLVSLLLSAPVLYYVLLSMGLNSSQGLLGVWIFVWLQGVFRTNIMFLLLIDQFQILLVLLITLTALQGWIIPTIILSIIASGFGERAPVFACIFSMSPLPAVGIVGQLLARKLITPTPPPDDAGIDFWWLTTPVTKVGHQSNHKSIFDYDKMLISWGPCVVLAPLGVYLHGMANITILVSLLIALCVAYAQLLIATDKSRLYQWAFVPVIFFSVLVVISSRPYF